ncbi:glyoxalase [Candidatus Peregrinibacteria bacterium CG11_big_fil_rev_8_21_14_0_20_46_8]|nr:MAG: glyoxalase [Candidatus Peregrinibacteria bacterium CG11_big_fil_rev_8_21_14_0_20_46_8]
MTKKDHIVHFEIPADDLERAQKFYSEIFGWEIKKFDMPATGSTGGEPYYSVYAAETDEKGMTKTPGAINGGMMKRKMPGQPFMNYISVDSIDEKLETIKEHGGEICMPKTEIAPDMGWIACFKDTEGNMMGLHQISPTMKK